MTYPYMLIQLLIVFLICNTELSHTSCVHLTINPIRWPDRICYLSFELESVGEIFTLSKWLCREVSIQVRISTLKKD